MAPFSRRGGASTLPPRLSAPAVIEYTVRFVPLAIYGKRYGAAALVTIVALKSISGTAQPQSSPLSRNCSTWTGAVAISGGQKRSAESGEDKREFEN